MVLLPNDILKELKGLGLEIRCGLDIDPKYQKDAGIFERVPECLISPKNTSDISKIVGFVSQHGGLSITPRAAGTDMTGGAITDSIILDMVGHMNRMLKIDDGFAVVEPGMLFRDFDAVTRKHGYILPSFPASRDYCTVGGMVANNAGGEKSLVYGKTARYVRRLKAVLSDSKEYNLAPLSFSELQLKMQQRDFEGELYRTLFDLIGKNQYLIETQRPVVSKNSSGYAVWDVWNEKKFDITKLMTGSQGTLGVITEIELGLVRPQDYSGMLVMFLGMKDMARLPDLVARLRTLGAETIEAYDKHTFKLATRYFYDFVKIMRTNIVTLGFQFMPEMLSVLTGGIPDMVILAEFSGSEPQEVRERIRAAYEQVRSDYPRCRTVISGDDVMKYRTIRRQSFQLLRSRLQGRTAAAFIDDLVVPVDALPEFLPQLQRLLDGYGFPYTIAGHVGDGNFHVIPLLNEAQLNDATLIKRAMDEVYDLIFRYRGSMTAEHNDGILRAPYLEKMFGRDMTRLFVDIKRAFDPKNIFNPGKKIDLDAFR